MSEVERQLLRDMDEVRSSLSKVRRDMCKIMVDMKVLLEEVRIVKSEVKTEVKEEGWWFGGDMFNPKPAVKSRE